MDNPGNVTQLLTELGDGNEAAFPALLSELQTELRNLAGRHLMGERPSHTLQATALVNEAYLRLVDQRHRNYESRKHFLAIASQAMRRILLQHARDRMAEKRGGGRGKVTLFEVADVFEEQPEDLLALEEALEHFGRIDPENARIVELRWFGGLSVTEAANVLDVSTRTIERGWRAARAWLRDYMVTS